VHLYLTSAIFQSINSDLKSLSIEALVVQLRMSLVQYVDLKSAIDSMDREALRKTIRGVGVQ